MKRLRSTLCIAAVVAPLAALVSPIALAGEKSTINVSVTDFSSGGTASGAAGTARNSSGSNQLIGCSIIGFSSGSGTSISCFARNSAGTYRSCVGSSDSFAKAVGAINSDSRIEFDWDQFQNCTYLSVQSSSNLAPKAP